MSGRPTVLLDVDGTLEAIEGASELIGEVAEAGATVVISSSGEQDEIDHYVDLLGVGEKIAGATTSTDAERSKPDPELVEVALERFGPGGAAEVERSIAALREHGVEWILALARVPGADD